MSKRKRKPFDIFSLSFLDCICCGFGAVLLLFVLSAGQQRNLFTSNHKEIDESREIIDEKLKSLVDELSSLKRSVEQLQEQRGQDEGIQQALNAQIDRLQKQKAQTQDILDRQQSKMVTDPVPPTANSSMPVLEVFTLRGQNILFLLEASGGMRGRQTAEVMQMFNGSISPPYQKWEKSKETLSALVATVPKSSEIAMFSMNEEFLNLHPSEIWFRANSNADVVAAFTNVEKINPVGPANLEKAFRGISRLEPRPDQIVLLVDGLPTTSTQSPAGSQVTAQDRMDFFERAYAALPIGIPVYVVLFPFEDDLDAAPFFWALSAYSKGSLITVNY